MMTPMTVLIQSLEISCNKSGRSFKKSDLNLTKETRRMPRTLV
jgi:hypothetical protein